MLGLRKPLHQVVLLQYLPTMVTFYRDTIIGHDADSIKAYLTVNMSTMQTSRIHQEIIHLQTASAAVWVIASHEWLSLPSCVTEV